MSELIRVCGDCLRPVSVSYYFFVKIGCTCPKCGRMWVEDTIKVPTDKANYEAAKTEEAES